ncbi:MAG: hypothetical protein OXG92_01240 [Chloroflexi bacterium]|nr:hypothetical protein [Chloroflexota bacterium]MCY3581227.1 hypothetical protein [Chloroflexota bacterium]MCY3715078.1 hypothetical protein [Chloroflexota bacterium]MDE2652109.1 hypothetical protein [Chloroflexota bacterium]
MIKRMLYLLAILLVGALTVVAAGHSQEVNCGDLSEADCQILIDNHASMHDLSAFHFEAAMDMEMWGTASPERLKLGMTGSGDLAMDSSAAEGIDDMAEQAEAVIDSLAGQMRFVIHIEDDGKTESIEVDMLMRDSVFLFAGSMVEELMGMTMEDMDWFGLDLTGAVAAMLAQAGISEDDARHDDTSDYAEPEPVITRLDDAEVNGAPVAVFESTIDMETMMSGDAETIEELMAPFGLAGTLGSGSMTNTHYIGLDDGYSYRQELSGSFSVGGLAMGEASGDMSATMSMTIDLSAFNEPVEVELPEDVPAFPLAMMLAMGSQ